MLILNQRGKRVLEKVFVLFAVNIIFLNNYSLWSQNQKIADSLVQQYLMNNDTIVPLEILNQITFHENNPDSGLKYADLLLQNAREHADTYYEIKALRHKGTAFCYLGNYDSALYWFFEALNTAIVTEDWVNEGNAYSALADVYSEFSNQNTSIYYYKLALRLLSKANDSLAYANILLNIGSEYLILNELDTAYHYSQKANKIYKKINYTTGLAYAKGNLGWINSVKGNYNVANKQIIEAISILESDKNFYAVSSYLNRLAKNKLEQSDYSAAIIFGKRSYELSKNHNFLLNAKDATSILSDVYAHTGSYKNAYKYQSLYLILNDSVNNSETVRRMADLRTEFEVAKKQTEIDMLSKTKKNQRLVGIGLGVVLFLSMLLLVVLYRNSIKHRDISKLLEEQKRELQVKNEQLDDLNNTKDRFFSIISHDLRGPISVLNGTTMLIREYLESKDYNQLAELTSNMEFSVKKVQNLLDNLLEWSLSQQGRYKFNPEQIELNELILEIIDIFHSMACSKEIEISYICKFDKIYITSDKNSLMTIIRNLISNALKFTERYGKITITVIKQIEEIIITFEDNGIGISQSRLNKLFKIEENKSTWGTEREKGLGIGLNLVYEFVKQSHGSIDVESKIGSGTKFIVKLPVLSVVPKLQEQL